MKKGIRFGIVWMVAAVVLLIMAPAMAATADTISLADGVYSEEVIQNEMKVVSVGEVPDPKYTASQDMMGGQSGMVVPKIREVTLEDKSGNKQTMTLGREMKNFNQIKEGDIVTFKVSRKVAFFIGKEGMVPGMGESTMKYSAPLGTKPGGLEVKESFNTLEIMKLDPDKKQVTVRLPDNTIKTVTTPRLDFTSVKVGQNVIVLLRSEQSIIVTAP